MASNNNLNDVLKKYSKLNDLFEKYNKDTEVIKLWHSFYNAYFSFIVKCNVDADFLNSIKDALNAKTAYVNFCATIDHGLYVVVKRY